MRAEIGVRVERLVIRAARADRSVKAERQERAADDRSRVAAARADAEAKRERALADLDADLDRRREEIAASLDVLEAQGAPGPFGAVAEDLGVLEHDGRGGAPDLVRRGEVAGRAALYPLFHGPGWWLEGDVSATLHDIRTQVVRAVDGLPLKSLRVDVFDPRIEGRLGGLAPLRSANARSFPPPSTSEASFSSVLEDVSRSAAQNAETLAGDHVRTLAETWTRRGLPTGEYRVVVVLNYPEGVTRRLQDQLILLARSGGPNGVTLLVQHDAGARPADPEVQGQMLARHLRKSRVTEEGELLLSDYPAGLAVRPDPPLSAAAMDRVLARAVARASADTGPVIPLAEMIASDAEDPWQGDGTHGLEVTIARAGQRPLPLKIRSQNPPLANALVGGAVGTGKSNLLLDIVYGLTARYSPDELELHLLDFKQGLEFQRFAADGEGRNWLPHARVLSLESDRAFGVAVLRNVVDELTRRADLFKASATSGIEQYRTSTGLALSRLLLIVDEFHVLFDGDDQLVDEAVELLETLSRQGRASGIHMLLASQTTTGVSGLRVKGESIFAQFPVRISLKNTASESEAILSQGNKAAADLRYRGELVVNRNSGYDPEGSNETGICAWADPEFVHDLQRKLWSMRSTGSPPLVFVASEYSAWADGDPQSVDNDSALGLLGRPVAVTDRPVGLQLDSDVDQAVAVVGSDASLAIPVLGSLVRSLSVTLGLAEIIVIDLGAADSRTAGRVVGEALDTVEADGVRVRRFGRDGAVEALLGPVRWAGPVGGTEGHASSTLVLGIGWQRWTGLDEAVPADPDDEDSFEMVTPREVLEDLSQRGALRGVHLVGWWSTVRSVQDHLGFSFKGVRHFVTAKLSLDDYRSLTSHTATPIVGSPRVGHIDRAGDAGPVVVVPFDLERSTR